MFEAVLTSAFVLFAMMSLLTTPNFFNAKIPAIIPFKKEISLYPRVSDNFHKLFLHSRRNDKNGRIARRIHIKQKIDCISQIVLVDLLCYVLIV